MLYFCHDGSSERRKRAGEEEKGSESQEEWDIHIHTISLAPLVFPLQGVSPPSIAHTPTV